MSASHPRPWPLALGVGERRLAAELTLRGLVGVTFLAHWDILFPIKGVGGDVRSSSTAVFFKKIIKIALWIINVIYVLMAVNLIQKKK